MREQQKTFPVTVLCKVMQVSTSAFYAWAKMPKDTDKKIRQKQLEAKAIELFGENKNVYGSRRLSEAFIKEDIQVGRYKARQLMKKLGLKPRYPKRFQVTTDSDHNETIAPNLLNRQFDVAAPNKVWTTDITYVWTLEGWLYVAIVVDLFSRQVVGWSIADNMRTSLCVNALQMAFWRRKPEPGLVHHSDRGSQYASHEYRSHLGIMKMQQSMSRKGNCWDNGVPRRIQEGRSLFLNPCCVGDEGWPLEVWLQDSASNHHELL
ncbi:IS3 family transposase [Methylobacter psychrophilus]|uniref:IS3 family transposase n=1 Tax=Methylobacter psychrophilus TaxID=96941 RepID=UPI0021D4D546|nr:IS3 family transposase [Methylobacter psychrophilus]